MSITKDKTNSNTGGKKSSIYRENSGAQVQSNFNSIKIVAAETEYEVCNKTLVVEIKIQFR